MDEPGVILDKGTFLPRIPERVRGLPVPGYVSVSGTDPEGTLAAVFPGRAFSWPC